MAFLSVDPGDGGQVPPKVGVDGALIVMSLQSLCALVVSIYACDIVT